MNRPSDQQDDNEKSQKAPFEMNVLLRYPNLAQYDWFQEYKQLIDERDPDKSERLGVISDNPPVQVDLILRLLRDLLSRPEVVAAWRLRIPEEDTSHAYQCRLFFREYLAYKYADEFERHNHGRAIPYVNLYAKEILRGQYSSIDDPQLRLDLLKWDHVYE